MEKREIKLAIDNEVQFYRYYIEILNAFKHLRDREKDVFAYLLLYNNQLKHQPMDIRDKLLLDYDIKLKIKEGLNLKDDNFNCIVHTLRQKGVLQDRRINPLYEVYPEYPFTLSFIFTPNENRQEEQRPKEDTQNSIS